MSRVVYIDESGTSKTENVTVVAGVIVDPDKQWKIVERYMDALIEEYVPEDYRDGFIFHATHLFHGSKIFDPKTYPVARRLEALRKLVEIPAKFGLPTVYGYQDKTVLPLLYKQNPHHQHRVLAAHQAVTYSYTAIAVERFMREHAGPEELATLTVEKNNPADSTVQRVHDLLSGKTKGVEQIVQVMEMGRAYLPIRKIIDCINFAAKDQAIMLQLADACAFIFRRYLEKKPHMEEFCDALTNNHPKVLEPEGGRDGTIDGNKILYFVPKGHPA